MSRQTFYDVPGGDTVIYDVVDESKGYRQAIFWFTEEERRDHFHNIKHVKCRDDDILLYSYPKTGTNWLWEMVQLMLQKSSQVSGKMKDTGMMEARPLAALDDMPSPRILNTHVKVQYTPKEAVDKKLKTVLVCRNPKDVVVSFFHHTQGINFYHYDGKFENYLQMFVRGEVDYGSFAEYLMEWQQHIRDNPDVPFHIVYYEDMKENCFAELKRLREFLELDTTDEMLQEITDNCNIDNMREIKERHARNSELAERFKNAIKPGFSFMRKGQVGDWKNWFTVAQSEMFDAWWDKAISGLDMFKFRYS